MQEAGLMNFLRTLLIIILIYYVLKYIGRIVFPIFFKKMMNSVEKKFDEQRKGYTPEDTTVKEGETVIDKTPKQNKSSNDKVGEYVDYEDVDE
jgi:hypothetical protein